MLPNLNVAIKLWHISDITRLSTCLFLQQQPRTLSNSDHRALAKSKHDGLESSFARARNPMVFLTDGNRTLNEGTMHESQIEHILEQLRALQPRFNKSLDSSIPSLDGTDRAKFKRLVIEAKSLVDAGLTGINDFGIALFKMQNLSGFGAWNPPTPDDLLEAIAIVEGGLNQVRRKKAQPAKVFGGLQLPLYVDVQRILEMQAVQSPKWDLRKLVRMLQEVNLAHVNEMHMATVMLVRAIADHVSPILGCKNFSEVANNYTAPRSFSDQMKHLDGSMRKIADTHLHQQVRKSEVLPASAQVDFRAALDVLLAEIVRVLR